MIRTELRAVLMTPQKRSLSTSASEPGPSMTMRQRLSPLGSVELGGRGVYSPVEKPQLSRKARRS